MPNGARKKGHFRKQSLKRAYSPPVNDQYLSSKPPVTVRFLLIIRVQDEREDEGHTKRDEVTGALTDSEHTVIHAAGELR